MKKLIFFAKHLDIGGVERSLLELLRALRKEDYELTLVLEEKRGVFLSELPQGVTLEEYRLSSCRFPPLRKLLNGLHRLSWALKHRGRYDFSCSYCSYSVLGSRLAQIASLNSCLWVHNDYAAIYPDLREFHRFADALRPQNFAHLVFVSMESRDGFLKRFPALRCRGQVINNLLDPVRLRSLAAQPCPVEHGEGEIVFLYLGRLEEQQKRLTRLLEGFSLASREKRGLRLLLVGDGPDRPLIEDELIRRGLVRSVTLLGALTNPYPVLRMADCLVLASDYEGFPVVCREALALGKDVISTVPVSDGRLDLREQATICDKTAEALAAAMLAYQPGNRRPWELAAENEANIRRVISLVEGETV